MSRPYLWGSLLDPPYIALRIFMNDSPHVVSLVFDPEYGDKLTSLAARTHVWVVDTPPNHAVASQIWAQLPDHPLEFGVTTFKVLPNSSANEQCLGMLDTIELHHGEYSHTPPVSVLEIIGLPFSEELRLGFAEFGYNEFQCNSNGFRATKA